MPTLNEMGLLVLIAICVTLEAGLEAPERWYGTLRHGKPFWRHL
jgi:hypothetical protein